MLTQLFRFIRNVKTPLAPKPYSTTTQAKKSPPVTVYTNISNKPRVSDIKKSHRLKKESYEIPDELRKAGVSKKHMDQDMIKLYKTMKDKGADKIAKKAVEKLIEEGESSDDIIKDIISKSPKPKGNFDQLFMGKKKFEKLDASEELPQKMQDLINKELQQFVIPKQNLKEKIYENRDLETKKKEEFKDIVKKDTEKAQDIIRDKEFGWLDKVKAKEGESKVFDEMVGSWDKIQQTLFEDMEDKDHKKLIMEEKKL